MTDPKTIPEQLDNARDGREFADTLGRLFGALEQAMEDEDA